MNEVLDEQSRLSLVRYRIERADETIIEAKLLAGDCHYNAAMNRLYYACYYAAVALLTKHHIPTATHAGVKTMLGLHFVSKGLITKESGRAFVNLFDSRQRGDYDEFVYATQEEVDELIPKAQRFIEEIDALL